HKRGSGGVPLSFFLHRRNTNTPLSPLHKRGTSLLHLFIRGEASPSPPLHKRGSGGVLLSFFLHRWNMNTPLSPLQKRGNFTSSPLHKRGSGGVPLLLLIAQMEYEHPFSPSSKEGKRHYLPLFLRGGRGVFLSPYFCTDGIRTPLYPLFIRGEIFLSPPLQKRGNMFIMFIIFA
ncbi:MAG: hypothetical protein ABFD61_00065, partial [Chloroherpetonaceae bacterium]